MIVTATAANAADATFRIHDVKRDGKITNYTLEKARTKERGLFVMFACYGANFQHAGQNAYDPKRESFKKTFTGNDAEPDSFFLKVYPNQGAGYGLRFIGDKPAKRTKIDNICSM